MSIAPVRVKASSHRFDADIVYAYMHEIGRVPLLTHEQEIVYGKRVQEMMAIVQTKEVLTQKLQREPTTAELAVDVYKSETDLRTIIQLGQQAKQKMIAANLRLVVFIAKKYQKRNVDFLDLIQEGTLGLERGVEKFDPSLGYKFSTYAYWWIRQGITRAIAQQCRTIRLPIHITEKLNKIKKVQRELSQQLGRSPTPAEIGQALNLDIVQLREYLKIARQPLSLDLKIGDNEDTKLQDLLPDESISPDEFTIQEFLRQDIENLLAALPPQQQQILILRFGLKDGHQLSLEKIGEQLHMSRERVRQLEKQALFYLRRYQTTIKAYLPS